MHQTIKCQLSTQSNNTQLSCWRFTKCSLKRVCRQLISTDMSVCFCPNMYCVCAETANCCGWKFWHRRWIWRPRSPVWHGYFGDRWHLPTSFAICYCTCAETAIFKLQVKIILTSSLFCDPDLLKGSNNLAIRRRFCVLWPRNVVKRGSI